MKNCLSFIILLILLKPALLIAREHKSFTNKHSLCFIENKGQVTDQSGKPRNDIQFKIPAAKGLNIFIGNGQLHYQWIDNGEIKNQKSRGNIPGKPIITAYDSLLTTKTYRMDVSLIGANPHAEIVTEEKQSYYENYHLAGIGKEGTRVNAYKKITYKNIYPNIDWVLYISSHSSNTSLTPSLSSREGAEGGRVRGPWDCTMLE